MKWLKLTYLFLVTIVLFSSCGKDRFSVVIDADLPAYENQLVLHCFIKNTDTTLRVGLSRARPLLVVDQELGLINDGVVTLYQDGNKLFEFNPADNAILNYEYNNGNLFGLKSGSFEIRASAPGYPEISATQSFPSFVPITAIDFEKESYLSTEGMLYDKCEITFTDEPGVENFYELSIVQADSSCINGRVSTDIKYIESNDIRTRKSASNRAILISDEGFDGETVRLIVGAKFGPSNGNDLQVSWKCITKEQYLYSSSLLEFSNQEQFGSFGDPISIFSNVENGIGIFGLANHQMYKLSDFKYYRPSKMTANILNGENFEACQLKFFQNDTSFYTRGSEINKRLTLNIENFNIGEGIAEISYGRRVSTGVEYFENGEATIVITNHDEENKLITGYFRGNLFAQNNINSIYMDSLEFELVYED